MDATLFVFYEISPSDEQKKIVEKEIKSFLKKIDPQATPDITSGDGSWWIVAMWWAGEKFLDWLAGKVFDVILNESQKRLPHSQNSTEEKCKSEPIASDSSNKLLTTPINDYPLDYSSVCQIMSELMNTIDNGSGCKAKIVLGIYNSSNDVGRVISLTKEEKDVTFSIMQTDSKDDYNTLTNP